MYQRLFIGLLWLACCAQANALESKSDNSNRNMLAEALSPYLVQHADNPIHWQVWDEDTLQLAKSMNKPILLSIGYATCHWCHVMEKESFRNEAVAEALNKSFISIKVDREERPDIDHIYMTALQLMKGEGGWPVTAFLTPEGEVFFVDSYLPAEKFLNLTNKLSVLWQGNESILRSNAQRMASQINAQLKFSGVESKPVDYERVIYSVRVQLDSENGGLLGAPKFPNEQLFLFLVNYAIKNADKDLIEAIDGHLQLIAESALFDSVSGGFYRYSVDAQWHEPHFEKMLYNQALLLGLYSKFYAVKQTPYIKELVDLTVAFILNDMEKDDLFFAAIDADSPAGEGAYYLFTYSQIKAAFPEKYRSIIDKIYDVSQAGNFSGSNILRLRRGWKEVLTAAEIPLEDWVKVNIQAKAKLLKQRQKTALPAIDKKMITAWNALMIKALFEAGYYFQNTHWVAQAEKSMEVLLASNVDEQGNLKRYSIAGQTSTAQAALDDYAFLIEALIAQYDVTSNQDALAHSEMLTQKMLSLFKSDTDGGFNLYQTTAKDGVLHNIESIEDQNYPSAYASAILVLNQLFQRTGKLKYQLAAKKAASRVNVASAQPERYATFYNSTLGIAIDKHYYFANGHGVVRFEKVSMEEGFVIVANIAMDDGWHINSNSPGNKQLIPTHFSVSNIETKDYPEGQVYNAAFMEDAIQVWGGSFQLKSQRLSVQAFSEIKLHVQACSDTFCLPEEMITTTFFE